MKTTLGPALALSLALLVLAGCGDDETPAAVPDPTPTPSATGPVTPSVTPSVTVEGPGDLVPIFTEREVAQLPVGTPTVADDGTGIAARLLDRGGRTLLEVRNGADVVTAPVPEDSDTPYLLDVQLELGQAGAGWVVGHEGGDSTRLQVWVVRAGRLVPAEPTQGDPDLGGGFTVDGLPRRTWFSTMEQPFTRVATGRPDQYRLYRWAVSGPGEGGDPGGGTDDLEPRLVAEEIGTVCVRESATPVVVRRC